MLVSLTQQLSIGRFQASTTDSDRLGATCFTRGGDTEIGAVRSDSFIAFAEEPGLLNQLGIRYLRTIVLAIIATSRLKESADPKVALRRSRSVSCNSRHRLFVPKLQPLLPIIVRCASLT